MGGLWGVLGLGFFCIFFVLGGGWFGVGVGFYLGWLELLLLLVA